MVVEGSLLEREVADGVVAGGVADGVVAGGVGVVVMRVAADAVVSENVDGTAVLAADKVCGVVAFVVDGATLVAAVDGVDGTDVEALNVAFVASRGSTVIARLS